MPTPQATLPRSIRGGSNPGRWATKQKGSPGSVTVVNASAKTVTEVVLTAGDQTATLPKPLAPKGRIALKLPKLKGCTVSVAATFEGGGTSDADAFNVCQAKLIRFTD